MTWTEEHDWGLGKYMQVAPPERFWVVWPCRQRAPALPLSRALERGLLASPGPSLALTLRLSGGTLIEIRISFPSTVDWLWSRP